MKELFLIFLGGGLGSVLRYSVSYYASKMLIINNFPIGTLLVNALGCILIGALSVFFKDNANLRLLFIIGFCGGFTTFSTFSFEIFGFWQNSQYFLLVFYLILSLILGFLGIYIGYWFFKS